MRFLGLLLSFGFRRLDLLLPPGALPLWLRLLLLLLRLLPARGSRGDRLAAALEAHGPVFVKFGQFLSTRPDIVPEDIAQSLARLRDNCEPLKPGRALAALRLELGAHPDEIFADFDPEPLAAASLAQVHTARLDGQEVVLKILRPGVEKRIERDLKLVYTLCGFLHRRLGSHLRLPEIADNYAHTLRGECDLRMEAARTSKMAQNAATHGLLYIPRVHWAHTTQRLLVLDRVSALPVTDVEALRRHGINMRALAERGVRIFFTQLFEDNFFHGDMHPGNIMVLPEPKEEPVYAAVDCAITGELEEHELLLLGRLLRALLQRDFRMCAELMLAADWVRADTVPGELELAIRAACEPVLEQPLYAVRFSDLLQYLLGSARRFGLLMQPSMALLVKTLVNIEGMGRQLDPELDFWGIAREMLESWAKRRFSPPAVAQRLQRRFERLAPRLERLPEQLLTLIEHWAAEHRSGSDSDGSL